MNRFAIPLLMLTAAALGWGCASFRPVPLEEVGFLERAESKTEGDLTVTVSVLSQDEARRAFDAKLHKKIQPVWPAFIRAGWAPTASMRGGSVIKTGVAGIFGTGYRYAPISPLYLFGRSQDIALQKARDNVHERNHLRLWLAPVTCRGRPVMIGQISRDIGTRLTTKSPTLTTHKIDPDVDETRAYLTQDLLYSQALKAWGHVDGGTPAAFENPAKNLTGDPYFTDGMISVYFLTDVPTSALEVQYLDWDIPPPR